MTATYTTQINVTGSWQEIQTGPVAGIMIFESAAEDCFYAVNTTAPSSAQIGHRMNPGAAHSVYLEAGDKLYIKSRSSNALVVYTYSDGVMIPGIDSRVYDGRFKAITTQPFSEANVKNGTQFYASHEYTAVAQGATVNAVFETGAVPVLIKGRSIATNGDNVLYSVYRLPTVSGGNAMTIQNYNEVDAETSVSSFKYGATVTTPGVLIDTQPVYGAVGSGNRVSGFQQTGGIERRLDVNSKYLVTFLNRSTTAAVDIAYGLTWYEGPLSTQV